MTPGAWKTALAALACTATTIGCAATAGDPPMTDRAGAPAAILAAMQADAARRAGVPESAVRVASVKAVTWRDGSLGCPQEGLAYPQALVPGWLALLSAGDRTLRYHAAERGTWFWCPDERAQPPLPGGAAI